MNKHFYGIKTANFPALTAGRRAKKNTLREIIMLGDSHTWGQGAPGGDFGNGGGFVTRWAGEPYHGGYGHRLEEYISKKFDFYDSMVCFTDTGDDAGYERKSDAIELISGKMSVAENMPLADPQDINFYTPAARGTPEDEIYGAYVERLKFGQAAATFDEFYFKYRMEHHASMMFLSIIKSTDSGELTVRFDHYSRYDLLNPGFPKVYEIIDGVFMPVEGPGTVIDGDSVKITPRSSDRTDAVYCIDWGNRQKGTLVFEGPGPVTSRGFFFDNNIVKTHGFGAHSIGAMLEKDGRRHIDAVKKYLIAPPYLVLVQAPVVNEWLSRTPLDKFVSDLDALCLSLKSHRNGDHAATPKTDILFFTTVGDKTVEYDGTDNHAVKYADYFAALREYCAGRGYGLLDFHAWFDEIVRLEGLDHEFLFDDKYHPSAFVNEFIARELYIIIDLIM